MAVTIAAFLIFLYLLKTQAVNELLSFIGSGSLRFTANWIICGLPILAALFLMHKPGKIIESLGLRYGILEGYGLAYLAVIPMILGFAFTGTFNTGLTVDEFIRKAVLAGFFEELFFRGFLFGMLFRYARWGFVPAVLAGALLFGAVHLYQGNDMLSALSAFGITAFGAVLFCWVYVEWDYNLWTAIGLHTFMNGTWLLFAVDSSATGNVTSNIFRVISILLIVVGTIVYKKKKFLPFEVNKRTLWMNNDK
jgi:membrane protease YdiL (CAAX protease family)